MKLAILSLAATVSALYAGTFTDDDIAALVHRIETLSEKEGAWPRIDTLSRASALLAGINPAKSRDFRDRAAALRKALPGPPPKPLIEVRPPLEDAIALGDRDAIENAAEQLLDAIEHSAECPDDYAWFAAARRQHDIAKGYDNASVRAREALFDLEDLVRKDFHFDLRDPSGAPVVLEPVRGVLTVVNFWASWCGPCVQEVPMLTRFARTLPGRVRLVGITSEEAPVVRQFVETNAPGFPALLDPDRTVFERYKIEAMPALIIVDGAGRVRYRSGAISEPELHEAIERLLPVRP